MFTEAASIGSLEIQVAYFRGKDECRASGWMIDGKRLGEVMGRIECVGGHTQIAKVLRHARQAHDKNPICLDTRASGAAPDLNHAGQARGLTCRVISCEFRTANPLDSEAVGPTTGPL